MTRTVPLPPLYLEAEAAEYLGISLATLRRERDRNNISYRKIGNRIKYTVPDLEEYIEKRRVSCKINSTLDKSENTGSPSGKDRTPGAEPGSITVHDKHAAHHLAQLTFKKPS